MTYQTKKNITFHVIHVNVSTDSRCSRTLPKNIAIESAHCGCEINLCEDWVLVEDVWKAWSNMIEGRALYQRVILKHV